MISVIGLGLSYEDLTGKHLELIGRAEMLVGGKRHLSYFGDFPGERVEISKDLAGLIQQLEQGMCEGKRIVLLASGDPLFYGIGSYLSRRFGEGAVSIYPNISSVGAAFARIGLSWQDARVISLHGRKLEGRHLADFKTCDKLAVLTDQIRTPGWLSETLESYGLSHFRICVLEDLGGKKERVRWFEAGEPVKGDFHDPNLMILLREPDAEKKIMEVYPGMPDDLFHHQRGLITKAEVRVVSLSKLRPRPDSVMWDLGAGSGSVSMEASYFIRHGQIFAVEQHKSRIEDIEANREKFGVYNLTAVHGQLPEGMDGLPDPDRVFIGGGGKRLGEIIERAVERLSPGGIIVVNTVLLGNMATAMETLERLGLETDMVQVQVSSSHKMPWNMMLKAQNPVWIIQGIKALS